MARVPAVREAAAAGAPYGDECARAFVLAMACLRVPPSARPTLSDLAKDTDAEPGRLVECLLFLKGSEEVSMQHPEPAHMALMVQTLESIR